MALSIAIEDPNQPETLSMLAEADAFYAMLYPVLVERGYLLDLAALTRPGVGFYVARVNGWVNGCGAIIRHDDEWGEIKRMYVDPRARGRGVGRMILEALEDHGRRAGLRVIRLETGVRQVEAIGLYRSAGFTPTGVFGGYVADHDSIFMEKVLREA